MHRMRLVVSFFGVISGSLALVGGPAAADLIKPDAGRSYPDIAADINGRVEYVYDADSGTGTFTMSNTPYLIAGGPSTGSEFFVSPDPDGVRHQVLRLKLDGDGRLVESPENMYELHGQIEANGQTFSRLLLKGTPTNFGALDLGPMTPVSPQGSDAGGSPGAGMLGVDIFDVDVALTDGALAPFFGSSAYLRITPELESTFAGSFAEDFTASKATSNTRSYESPQPFPIPEPSTVVVLAAGGLGLLYLRHRRLASAS